MQLITQFNYIVWILFALCYSYQIFYIAVPFFKKEKTQCPAKANRFAVMISARNESSVIKNLLDSIAAQTYPSDMVDVYVVADNCTDNTADIARECGVNVYERFDKENVGKGYALNFLLKEIKKLQGADYYDGYMVFDADNVLDVHYIEEMNKTFSNGYEILTSYRNSKNYGDNWISAGYGLWFLRESVYLNYARMLLGSSCAISGTGFMFSKKVAKELNGWNYYLLTEDIEFTVDHVINNYRIGFSKKAVLFDEQPKQFAQSVRQRMRWAKGYLQVFANYGKKLLTGAFRDKSFSCYDMSMSTMPAIFISLLTVVLNSIGAAVMIANGSSITPIIDAIVYGFLGMYGTLYGIGAITTVTEWNNIYTTNLKKVLYTFTFPIFMMTYIPITIMALFKKVEWKPIVHSESKTLAEIKSAN